MAKTLLKENLVNLLELKNQTDSSADLFLYGDIVSSWWGVWDKEDQYPAAIRDFIAAAGGKNINVHINSNGGSVFAGIAIYNMLKNYGGAVTVYIDGIAASIASVIAMAGDRIVMRTGSALMVHKPMFCLYGGYNAEEMRDIAAQLDAVQECIMQVYDAKKKSDVQLTEIEKIVNAETWLTSQEAQKYFDIEEESMQAVACESEFMLKFINMPEEYRLKAEEKAEVEAKLTLLELQGTEL